MIKCFHDFYGCHASIIRKRNQTYDLFVRMSNGKLLHKKNYASYRGARIAMGKWSDCWEASFN